LLYGDLVANARGHISMGYGVAMRTRTAKDGESLQRVPSDVLVRFSDEISLLWFSLLLVLCHLMCLWRLGVLLSALGVL
jgi:hypothetical protein